MKKKSNVLRVNFKRKPVVPLHKGMYLTPKEWLARDLEPQDPLLGELFTTTARILFSADTGAGKTMIGLALAFSMHLGRDFLHWKAHRKARVLYIDAEMPRDLLRERITEACGWFGIEAPADGPIILNREDFEDMDPLDTEEGKKWLKNKIKLLGPFDFIILDNLQSLCVGIMKEEESWRDIKQFVFWLTKERIGQLWFHHTGLDKSRAYGTKTREWIMDTVMVGESHEEDHVKVDVKFPKARRRKPSNASDFKPVLVELLDRAWTRGEVKSSTGGRPNKSDEIALSALHKAVADADGPATEEAWKKYAYKSNITTSKDKDARRMAFSRARDNLIEQGKVIKVGEQFDVRT